MLRISIFLVLCLIIQNLSAQQTQIRIIPEKSSDIHPFTSDILNDDLNEFQFAIVTDRTGGHREGVFEDAVNKLNLLQPEFVMSVGDLIEGYTENTSELKRQWEEFEGFVDQLEMPFFYVPGNHDITNQVMEDLWYEKFGNTYYAFTHKDVLFLCLNSEDQKRGAGKGTISDEQFKWIEKTLKVHENVKWTLVFMHQALWTQKETERWKDVEALLENRSHQVFTGHYHRYTKYERNSGKYFVLATTGGGSGLRGPQFGEFDHVVWVSMKKEGPVVANLLLEGIWDENVLTNDVKLKMEALEDVNPFQFDLLFEDDLRNGKNDFNLKVTNSEDLPMNIRFYPSANFDMALFPEKEMLRVEPNNVDEFTFSLESKAESIGEAIPLKAEISFEDDKDQMSVTQKFNIQALAKHSFKESIKKPKVDGNLKEWGELRYEIESEDPNSLSAKFDLYQDGENLYLAANVKDDKVIVYGSGSPWTQDYIGLCMNAEKKEKSALSVGKSWYKNEMYYLQTPEMVDKRTRIWPPNKLPEGSAYKCVANDDGYTMEWSIPLSYIIEKQGEDWESIRFNLMIGDKDIDEKEPKMYYWKANWRSGDNILGSGLFFK